MPVAQHREERLVGGEEAGAALPQHLHQETWFQGLVFRDDCDGQLSKLIVAGIHGAASSADGPASGSPEPCETRTGSRPPRTAACIWHTPVRQLESRQTLPNR